LTVDTDTLYVDRANNRVGIGTTSPEKKLHLNNSNNAPLYIQLTNSTTGTEWNDGFTIGTNSGGRGYIINYENEDIYFWTNAAEQDSSIQMVIASNGNVGIGTTNPVAKLTIGHPTIDDAYFSVNENSMGWRDGMNNFNNHSIWLIDSGLNGGVVGGITNRPAYNQDADYGLYLLAGTSNNWDDWVPHMAIKSDGNVGIGTTEPGNKLEVAGNVEADGFTINGVPVGTSSDSYWSASSGNIYYNSGNVGIGTTEPENILAIKQGSDTDPIADSWTTYSSKRWKENIQPIKNAIDKVMRLRGVYFNWKANGKRDIGMIAEEVGEVIPEVVAYEDNGMDAKSLDYARLTAVLVQAIKEQQKEIEKLKKAGLIVNGNPSIESFHSLIQGLTTDQDKNLSFENNLYIKGKGLSKFEGNLSVVGEGIFKNGLKIGLSPGYGLVIDKNGNVKMKGDLEVEGDIILQNISLAKR